MSLFNPDVLKSLYVPSESSHKPQNGSVMLIGGSQLFHAASVWALTVISRIVDMTFYASVEANNDLIQKAKEEFRNGIVVPRDKIDEYIKEVDVVLIGPGLPRKEGLEEGDDDTKELTEKLLKKYPDKKWVIDGGSLQVIKPEIFLNLVKTPIITPHKKEFEKLFGIESGMSNAQAMAKKYNLVILLKGEYDIVVSSTECIEVKGGNSGMTKGGTGDVLAGLVAALYAKNDAFVAACASSYINKKAGESLFGKVGYYFNATDLADEIPKVMKKVIID